MKTNKFTLNLLLVILVFSSAITVAQTKSNLLKKNNIIVFCDLSERLARENQIEKDKQIINHLLTLFANNVKDKYRSGLLRSYDSFSIHYNPQINNSDVASNLSIDFSNIDKKKKINHFTNHFMPDEDGVLKSLIISDNVDELYASAWAKKPNFPGSDLYSFFKGDLPNLVREGYDNYLIIITDGYVYMSKSNPKRIKNKLGHLEGGAFDALRNNSSWEELYFTDDWGMISTGKTFANLKVLGLEFVPDCINNTKYPRTKIVPLKPCINEFELLTKFWSGWFADMGVNDINILKSKNNINPSMGAIKKLLNN